MIDWAWIARNLDEIGSALAEHLELTLIAVGVGFLLSFLATLVIYRFRRLYGPIAGVTGIIYTIPSLALFAFLVPFTGLSLLTAEIGLIGYTLLILIRNTEAGLDGVPPDVREAAEGMGYTGWQRLWRVELPLAMPVIVAGLRVATVTTIGLVMVTALIGQGGLGQLMLRGFTRGFPTAIYVGAFVSVVLALIVDAGLVAAQRAVTPWTRPRRV
jgi:osmoprotectant transport system permease protein